MMYFFSPYAGPTLLATKIDAPVADRLEGAGLLIDNAMAMIDAFSDLLLTEDNPLNGFSHGIGVILETAKALVDSVIKDQISQSTLINEEVQ